MKIKRYKEFPEMYVPDIGEVILARRTPVECFLRATVIRVRRLQEERVRVTVQWMEADPTAGTRVRVGVRVPAPITVGRLDRITFHIDRIGLLLKSIDTDRFS